MSQPTKIEDVEIDDKHIKIPWAALIGSLNREQRVELIEYLSCEDEVIEHVASQLITGWTKDGISHGSDELTPLAPGEEGCRWKAPLSRHRRSIALGASEVAAEEIDRISRSLANERKRASRAISGLYTLRSHFWNNRVLCATVDKILERVRGS